MERTGRTGGLVKAVRHIAKEAEELAASYADLGADHAGPLFNRVMGNQASDGAYFTRPVAASIAARLTLDALGEQDWTDEETWKVHKTVDLASSNEGDVVLDPFCGCGTAIAAAERLNRRWIGIDITHIAITLIRHRLHDAFKDELKPIAPQGIILEMPLSFLVSRFCPSTGRFRTRAVLTAGRNRGHKFRPS